MLMISNIGKLDFILIYIRIGMVILSDTVMLEYLTCLFLSFDQRKILSLK